MTLQILKSQLKTMMFPITSVLILAIKISLRFEKFGHILVRTRLGFMIGKRIPAYNISDNEIKLILGSKYAR